MKTCIVEKLIPLSFKKNSFLCDDFFYRFQRYGINFSISIFYSKENLDIKIFEKALRKSDKLLELQKNLFCIIFDVSNEKEGLKASENIISLYERTHFSQSIYISFVNSKSYTDISSLKSHLISFLDYSIKNDLSNKVVDGYYELELVG